MRATPQAYRGKVPLLHHSKRTGGSRGGHASTPAVHSVTTAASAVHDDSDERLHRYLITMAIRTGCFIAAVWTVYGMNWVWGWVFVPGAVVLPYLAVVGANAHEPRQPGTITPVLPAARQPEQLSDRPWRWDSPGGWHTDGERPPPDDDPDFFVPGERGPG